MLRSLRLQWTSVFCSKSDDLCGNGMKVTQITTGANALGAWGQTGANTANFVESSLQSEGLLGAQRHLHMLGPFGKVPDRLTGAIFHALVQCVAPRGSQLYQNQNPICQLIAGAFVFLLSSHRICWPLLCRLFLPAPSFWVRSVERAHLYEACTQVPVSCLRSYCRPFRTPSQGKAPHSYGSCLFFLLILPLCSSPPSSVSFQLSSVYLSFYPSFRSSLSCWLSPAFLLFSLPFDPQSLCLSLLYSQSLPFLFLFLHLSCPFSSHISDHLLSHNPLLSISVLKGLMADSDSKSIHWTNDTNSLGHRLTQAAQKAKLSLNEVLHWSQLHHTSLSQPAPLPWQWWCMCSGPCRHLGASAWSLVQSEPAPSTIPWLWGHFLSIKADSGPNNYSDTKPLPSHGSHAITLVWRETFSPFISFLFPIFMWSSLCFSAGDCSGEIEWTCWWNYISFFLSWSCLNSYKNI